MAMTSLQADLDRILTDTYLGDIESRSLEDIRAMRAECQAAEVALSYLRRLTQGRIDIVHSYLDRPTAGDAPDLTTLVDDLPGILSGGSGRPSGPGHLPLLLAPDTEGTDLTDELDSVLGADNVGRLADLSPEELRTIATGLEAIENRISYQRRGMHERIDALQAELVGRYKTGHASVDGLLS